MTYPLTEEMRRTFANRFLKWEVLLREAVINGGGTHEINKGGWHIIYVEGQDDQGHYLEFYAKHPDQHDTHFRIYQNGEMKELEALLEGYDYDPALPGDQFAQRNEFIEKNRKIFLELKLAGLHV